MRSDLGFLFFTAGIVLLMLAAWIKSDQRLSHDQATCRYSVDVMKLDSPDKEKVAVAYCMQKKGWK